MEQRPKSTLRLTGGAAILLASTTLNAAQSEWTYQYNHNGQVVLADGPRMDVDDRVAYAYDTAGNRTSVTNALGHVTTMTDHNARGQPQRLIDANGVETRLVYNPLGWIVSSTIVSPDDDPGKDVTTAYAHDSEGMLLGITLADGVNIINEYDNAQRLVATTNSLGERLEYTLDAAGNRVAEKTYNSTGMLLRDIKRSYDELNRLINVTGAAGQVSSYSYDRNGNLSSITDGNSNTTVQYYDPLDRRIRSEAAYAHHVTYRYDLRDNLTGITDPGGASTHYILNGFDQLTALDSPDEGISNYYYDSVGNRIVSTDANGSSTQLTYDALNRPLQSSFTDTSLNITYGYDAGAFGKGRLTSVNDASGITLIDYDHRGNVVFEGRSTGEHAINIAYDYNPADRITKITYPSGRTVDYSYDTAGRPVAINTTGPEGSRTIASNAQYLPFGPATSLVLGNGIQMNASYNQDYRLTSLVFSSVFNRDYEYDRAGNIIDIADRRNSLLSQSLGYDSLNRLGTASGGYGNLSYSYDENGNRLTYTNNQVTDQFTYDAGSNRLLGTNDWVYRYDANGNVIAKSNRSGTDEILYHYDDRNRLARVTDRKIVQGETVDSEIARYTYNSRNQRTRKQTPDADIHYVYGQRGELLAEINGEGISLREYIYFNNRPIAVANATFTYEPPESGPETLLDDSSPGTSSNGTWDQVRKKGAYGDYYHRSDNSGNHFRWHPGTLKDRDYEIYAWWPKSRKNNPSATYRIQHSGQVSTVIANQSRQGKQWVYLGTYPFNGNGNEYVELSDNGGTTAADGIRLVEMLPPPAPLISTAIYYIHSDHLGTPQTLTDQAQRVAWNANYRPFGMATIDVAEITHNLRFPGQYFDDETGLHQNHFRYYNSALGRYSQADPLGLAAGSNPYHYANNSPHVYVDPYGLAPSWVGPTAIAISTTGGALVLHPNPVTPPWVRATGLAMVGIGGALEVWDWATAMDDIKEVSSGDALELKKNIEKINQLLESQNMLCE